MTNTFRRFSIAMVGVEVLAAGCLFAWRLNSTLPSPPPVDLYVDAITGRELLALPDQFLFDGTAKWRTLGETYMATGFYAKAEACLDRAAECDRHSAEIALSHGYCLERLGMLDEAWNEYRRAAKQGRRELATTAWYRVGRIHLQREQPVEAKEAFEQAGPDHLPSLYQRSRLLVRSGRAAEAEPLLNQLAKGSSDDLLVWQLRAQAARATPSLQLDEAHLKLSASRAAFGFERELTQARLKKAGRNVAAAERLVRLTRDDTHWQNQYLTLLQEAAEAQLEQGNTSGARILLERQIELEELPTARAWELSGAVEFLEKHSDRAWDDWSRAERMRPDAVDHSKLARIALEEGDRPSARRQEGLAHQFAGIESFRSNKLDAARSELRQAVAAGPDLWDAWFYIGECERLLDDRSAAEAAYRRCLALNSTHGRARERLRRLENLRR
jgi:tetratricopeptide (TPR) repeat protein